MENRKNKQIQLFAAKSHASAVSLPTVELRSSASTDLIIAFKSSGVFWSQGFFFLSLFVKIVISHFKTVIFVQNDYVDLIFDEIMIEFNRVIIVSNNYRCFLATVTEESLLFPV